MIPVLIMGCGYVGQRLIKQLPNKGEVCAVSRSDETCEALKRLGVRMLQYDLDTDKGILPTKGAEVFYLVPPPTEGETDARIRRFLANIQLSELPRRIVYISTSGVYGDCQGEWIAETRAINPGTPRGKRRADAERALLGFMQNQGVPVVILRVPGIYGPNKLPLVRLQKGLPLLREEDSPYTNRVHVDDLVAACLAAMEKGVPGAAYNVSDGNPSNMTDYFNRIADTFGLSHPPVVSRDEAVVALSKGMQAFMGESKRLDITKLKDELGVIPMYSNLEDGLKQCREEMTDIF